MSRGSLKVPEQNENKASSKFLKTFSDVEMSQKTKVNDVLRQKDSNGQQIDDGIRAFKREKDVQSETEMTAGHALSSYSRIQD